MAQAASNPKQQAHQLIDLMSNIQAAAAVGLFKVMLDPVAIALAAAPLDDEPVPDDEAREIAESRTERTHGDIIPHEEVLGEFGLSVEDFERMGRTPLSAGSSQAGF